MTVAPTMNIGMLRYQDQLKNKQDALPEKEAGFSKSLKSICQDS
jgi:hypothetical protein